MPIKSVISKGRVPVKIWSDIEQVESSAIDQLVNTASLPFVFKHVAAMPDVHLGKGATVGSVIATEGAICPAAVGVDIGCGMMAVRTNAKPEKVIDKVGALRHSIERSVPVGRDGNKRTAQTVTDWAGWHNMPANLHRHFNRATQQLGSLGGGNHFIEVCLDQASNVWVMLHSGSRYIGKAAAEYHIDKAKDVMKKLFIGLPDPELAYLAQKTPEFDSYMMDLNWCQSYAAQNRHEMMCRVLKDLAYAVNDGLPLQTDFAVNCHHNYVATEHHYGRNVLVTRKGAVRARQGDLGIIPGSMGTRSYIVRGLGSEESFHSCSHGAGRRMSRSAARKAFTVADLESQTAGVDCRKDEGVLDEIPGSYKDIDVVMENQKDLVEIVATLKQVLCVKG